MKEICLDTVMGDGDFPCHETTDLGMMKKRACAGKLILEEKVNKSGNRSTRMLMVFGLFPGGYDSLKNKELVFETVAEAIKHHT